MFAFSRSLTKICCCSNHQQPFLNHWSNNFSLQQLSRKMSGMVKAYNQVVSVRIGNHLVSMSIVEKLNESGISYNQRLFILVHDSYFGYLSKVKISDQPDKIKIEEAKVKIPIKNLYTAQAIGNMLKIKFTHEADGKLVPKQWILRITTAKLVQLWKELLDYEFKVRVKANSPVLDKKTNAGSRKSAEINDSSKEKKSVQSSKIKKPEATPAIQANEPIINSYSQAKPIQMTGSFDNSLFGDDSDDDDTKKRKKSARKSSTINNPSPPKEERTSTIEPKPSTQPLQPISKPEDTRIQSTDEQKNQLSKNLIEETSLKKNEKESPIKRSRIQGLSLPSIIQQAESTPKKSETKSIRQSAGKVEENIELPPTQKNMLSSGQRASLRSEEMRRTSNRQEEIKSKSLTAEEKDLGLIAQIVRQLQQQNQRFPFKQIAYDHNQFQTFFRPYKNKLSSTNSSRIERIMNAVLDQMRDRNYVALDSSANTQPNWIYRQLTQDEAIVIQDFSNHCKQLMKSLVLELHSRIYITFKKIRQEQQFIYFTCQDLQIKIPLILKAQNKKDPSVKVLQLQAHKAVKNQFKGLSYLHKLIENRGQLRVPLACLCEYGGIVALFKAKAVCYQNSKYSQLLNRQLQRLQDLSNLPLSSLLKNSIRPLNEFYYNQMRRGQTNIKFRFHFVTEINKLFIYDIQAVKQGPNKVLRMEFLQKEVNHKILPFVEVDDLQTNREIANFNNKIQQKISRATASINNLQFLFVSPKELSDWLHGQGLNMRYLVQIYLKTEDQFSKSLIFSELMARTIKKLLSKTLQDICLQQKNEYKDINQMENALKIRVIDFVNCLLGNNLETQALWKLVSANARHYYSAQIQSYQNVSKGQLLISIAYHCSLSLSWRDINSAEIFRSSKVISMQKLKSVEPKIKVFKATKSSRIETFNQRIQSETNDNFSWIVSTFELKKQKFPPELILHEVTDKLRLYLCNFIQPDQLDWQNNYSHLSLYMTDEPSTSNFQIDLAMVKWYLRKGNKYKCLNKFNEITSKITRLYGNNHPFLSQLYEAFSNHHRTNGQIEDAISFMKSSLLNISAISGDNNKLMTEKCVSMFELLIAGSKQSEAYEYLRKAKKIIQNSPTKKVSLYGKIQLELATKAFREHKENEALKQLQNVGEYFQIYEKEQVSFEGERARLYQLLHVCYQKLNKKAELGQLCLTLQQKLGYFKSHHNFQEILWILIQTFFKNAHTDNKQAIFKVINELKINHNVSLYKKALNFMQKRYSQKNLFIMFRNYCENAPKIVGMVLERGILKDWQPLASIHERQSLFDFVSLVQQLAYLFGRDRLNSIQSKG